MKRQAITAAIGLAVAGGIIAIGAIAVFLGSGPLRMGAVSATDGTCNTTVSTDPASAGDNSIRVDDPAGCDVDDWIVVNEGGLTEECQQIKVLALNLHLNILFLHGTLTHDHSVGETVVEVAQCPTPTPEATETPTPTPTPSSTATATPTATPPGSGQMHFCPEAGKWSIATWSGQDGMPTGDALAFCPQQVDAVYRIDPDSQAWTRYFQGRPDLSNLATIDDGQGVMALGAGVSASSAAGDEPLRAAANGMLGCPQASKWAISVWTGASATPTDQAVAGCTGTTVAAAYWIDPQTQVWSRWFAGRPDVSTLGTLEAMQGVFALGAAGSPTPTPTPTATPAATATPEPLGDIFGEVQNSDGSPCDPDQWPLQCDAASLCPQGTEPYESPGGPSNPLCTEKEVSADGTFSFLDVTSGDYTVHSICGGCFVRGPSAEKDVHLEPGEQLDVTITLP